MPATRFHECHFVVDGRCSVDDLYSPVSVCSTRAPGVDHIAAAPKCKFPVMTSHPGGNEHDLIMARCREVIHAQLAGSRALHGGNGKLSMWTYASFQVAQRIFAETNAAYVASDRTIVRTDAFFHLVSGKLYANIQVNRRESWIQVGTGNHLMTKTGRCVEPSGDCSVTGPSPVRAQPESSRL